MTSPILIWFRRDLRLADNPALTHGLSMGRPVLPVFIRDPADRLGAASDWWLHHSLAALTGALEQIGLPLILRQGPAETVLRDLVTETGAGAVFWNRLYDPPLRARDAAIKAGLKAQGLTAASFPGNLIREPWETKTGTGQPYSVFTPFWKTLLTMGDPPFPLPAPEGRASLPRALPRSDSLSDWGLLPTKPDWAGGMLAAWTPGEAGAHSRLESFLLGGLNGYRKRRDIPADNGVSRLSPHLHFGEMSARQLWHVTLSAIRNGRSPAGEADAMGFLRELGWRDFSHHLLFHRPEMETRNFNPRFDAFPWVEDDALFQAWARGRTGYPIIDAGMRELWVTGYMHNRVRMVVASFLVKHLLIDWRRGEAWFRDTLVDADRANNVASWQWVAGSGADAAPYFRVFNPIIQGEKFDPDGRYVRRHVPELAKLPDRWLHKPWEAPRQELAIAGVTLGGTYPLPVVEHAAGREGALAAYAKMREEG